MKKISPLVSIGVRNGLIAAGLSIALLIAMYYMGRHPLMVSPFLDFRILLFGVFILFTLREFRESHQEGALYFWQGMMGSFITVSVTATLASLMLLAFCAFEPTFMPSYIEAMTDYLKTFPKEDIARIGKDIYERNLALLPSTNSKQVAGLYFAQSIVIGLFVSIILSVILRKQPKQD
jgi:hypothetical protein